MNSFSKEKDEILIEFVRCNTLLYDASNINYKNNVCKHRAWENISETLKIPVSDVKKRWKHLRDHYMKKKKADIGTGQARSQHTWEYMSQLAFLSHAPSQRNTLTNTEFPDETENRETEQDTQENVLRENETSFQNDHNIPNINASISSLTEESFVLPSRKKKRKSNENSLAAILEKRQEERTRVYEKILSEPAKSSTQKFFVSMADIVSQFPPHLAAETRLKVCQIVTEMEIKKHNNEQLSATSTPMSSNDSSDSWLLNL